MDREEVDIGVGVQVGPWGCYACGWTEGSESPPMIINMPDDSEGEGGEW